MEPNIIQFGSPTQVTLEVTNRCNIQCKYCLIGDFQKKSLSVLSYEEFKRLISDLSDLGVFTIDFSGGEPFLRSDLLNLLKYARTLNISVKVTTNGTILRHNIIDSLIDIVDVIQISIDGSAQNIHNTTRGGELERIIKSAELIGETGIKLQIGTVACQSNFGNIPKIIELAEILGASSFNLMDLQIAGWGMDIWSVQALRPKQWKDLIEFFLLNPQRKNKINLKIGYRFLHLLFDKKFLAHLFKNFKSIFPGCPCGRDRCTITSDGNVLPCDLARSLSVGNIKNTSFRQLWQCIKEKILLIRDSNTPLGCEGCEYLTICEGGCMAVSYNIFGRLDIADPRCPIAASMHLHYDQLRSAFEKRLKIPLRQYLNSFWGDISYGLESTS